MESILYGSMSIKSDVLRSRLSQELLPGRTGKNLIRRSADKLLERKTGVYGEINFRAKGCLSYGRIGISKPDSYAWLPAVSDLTRHIAGPK
jgi:hypothetical protein